MVLHKILKIVAIILSLVGIVFLAIILWGNTDFLSPYITVAYIVLGLAFILTVLFSILQLFTHKETLKKSLISFGLFILVIVIAYIWANGEVMIKNDVEIISASGSKWVDTGLKTFYILAMTAVGLMVFSGIKKLIKN